MKPPLLRVIVSPFAQAEAAAGGGTTGDGSPAPVPVPIQHSIHAFGVVISNTIPGILNTAATARQQIRRSGTVR